MPSALATVSVCACWVCRVAAHLACVMGGLLTTAGCHPAGEGNAPPQGGALWSRQAPPRVLGEPGREPGQLTQPRAAAVSPAGDLFVVDRTGRIQKIDPTGRWVDQWALPYATDPRNPNAQPRPHGYPLGLTLDRAGRLLVADTHYHRVLVYRGDGSLEAEFGRYGQGPGEFIYPTSIALDTAGHIYVAEYGGNDRIQKFSADYRYLSGFGQPGRAAGRLSRPQALLSDGDDRLWVTDACNHRLCLYRTDGTLLKTVGGNPGNRPGEFLYPYGLARDADGGLLVAEMGNNRIQRLDADGQPREVWYRPGGADHHGPLVFRSPWAVVCGPHGGLVVVDTGHHRLVAWHP